jgi:hypothetical protein
VCYYLVGITLFTEGDPGHFKLKCTDGNDFFEYNNISSTNGNKNNIINKNKENRDWRLTSCFYAKL